MGIPLDEILSISGNKYEKTAAIIKYARYLAQVNDDALEVHIGGGKMEKVTLVALRDILNENVPYEITYEDNDE